MKSYTFEASDMLLCWQHPLRLWYKTYDDHSQIVLKAFSWNQSLESSRNENMPR